MSEIKVKDYIIPRNLLYTETHEWVKVENNHCRIGVTDYAQKKLHEIVGVDLPEVGSRVEKREILGVLESIKITANIYAPISVEIIEVNKELEMRPELINREPYGSGYITIAKIMNRDELKELLSPEKYAEQVSREE